MLFEYYIVINLINKKKRSKTTIPNQKRKKENEIIERIRVTTRKSGSKRPIFGSIIRYIYLVFLSKYIYIYTRVSITNYYYHRRLLLLHDADSEATNKHKHAMLISCWETVVAGTHRETKRDTP